jgi:hypothetical protein
MKAFTEFEDKDITENVTAANSDYADDLEVNTKFLSGDHWQDGEGWAGALPESAQDRGQAIKKIKALFTSQNVIKSITERHKSAVIGKSPEWTVTPKQALAEDDTIDSNKQEDIDEIEAALTGWWYRQDAHDTLVKWAAYLLLGARSILRIYIPIGFLQGETIGSGELSEQLDKIRVEAVSPDMGAVVENKEQSTKAGMISFTNTDDEEVFEISYLNEEGKTIIKNVSSGTETDPLELGGHLSIYEGSRDLFITEQIRQQNKLVNKALTMMNNNVDSGFLERVFLNAQPPGEWKTNDDGNEYFKPAPYAVGPGTTNFIGGAEYEKNDQGEKAITNPSVTFREPVPNNTFVEAKSEAYASILQEAHQMHALISGDATASGESRIQALSDFIMDAESTKATLDSAGKWLIETVMYLAFDLSGNESKTELYKATFDSRLDPGTIPAEMRKAIINQVDEGLLSRDTAMSMLGIDDVDAELAKIDSAAQQAIELLKDLRDANINSKTLTQRLIGIIIADKQFITEALEDADLTAIDGEIEAQSNQNAQEADLFNELGV